MNIFIFFSWTDAPQISVDAFKSLFKAGDLSSPFAIQTNSTV